MKLNLGNLRQMELIIDRLERAFDLTYDLFESLSESNLNLKLKDLPSNKIRDQVWCVIGARESYLNAIKKSKWSGFNCSLESGFIRAEVLAQLKKTQEEMISYLKQNEPSEVQVEIVLDLLEHEIQHHGQLIRYVYGNKLNFPNSWNKRYTV